MPTATPDEADDGLKIAPCKPPADEHATHFPAGEGKYWTAKGSATAKSVGVVHKSAPALPEGFVTSVFEAHTAKQYADYLPTMPNLNIAKSVGVVKPRQILEDWTDAEFDPWSAGKDPFSTSFIPSLFIDVETGEDMKADEFADAEGLDAISKEKAAANKLKHDLDLVFSWTRHGKYPE